MWAISCDNPDESTRRWSCPCKIADEQNQLTTPTVLADGKSWIGGLLLDGRDCSYPYGYQASEGTIYVSYERPGWSQAEILLARFTEADVRSGKAASNAARLRLLVNKSTGDIANQLKDKKSNKTLFSEAAICARTLVLDFQYH